MRDWIHDISSIQAPDALSIGDFSNCGREGFAESGIALRARYECLASRGGNSNLRDNGTIPRRSSRSRIEYHTRARMSPACLNQSPHPIGRPQAQSLEEQGIHNAWSVNPV